MADTRSVIPFRPVVGDFEARNHHGAGPRRFLSTAPPPGLQPSGITDASITFM